MTLQFIYQQGKESIELAVQEARSLGHHYIGTEHLLLGLSSSLSICVQSLPGLLRESFHGLIHVRKATWRLFLERIRQEWDK
jgi:hypothetical protein